MSRVRYDGCFRRRPTNFAGNVAQGKIIWCFVLNIRYLASCFIRPLFRTCFAFVPPWRNTPYLNPTYLNARLPRIFQVNHQLLRKCMNPTQVMIANLIKVSV